MAKSPKIFTSHSPPRARTLSGPATRRRWTRELLKSRNRAFGPNGVPTTSRQTSVTRTDTTSRLPISRGSTNKRYEPSELRFYFTLAGDAIAQLIVIPANAPDPGNGATQRGQGGEAWKRFSLSARGVWAGPLRQHSPKERRTRFRSADRMRAVQIRRPANEQTRHQLPQGIRRSPRYTGARRGRRALR